MRPYIFLKLSEISSGISKLSLAMFKSIQKPNHRPIIAFILPKYQILAKFRPKWVSGSENDSLSVSKYTELSSGISKLPCKTLCFLQKPKNRPKNVFIWPKYQIWSKLRHLFGPKNVEKKSFKPKQIIGRAKTCREDLRTVIQIDLNYLYLKLLALKCIFWSKNDFWALFWPKKGPGS